MKKPIPNEVDELTIDIERRLDDLCTHVHSKAAEFIAQWDIESPMVINRLMDVYIHAYTQSVLDQKAEFEKELLKFAQ